MKSRKILLFILIVVLAVMPSFSCNKNVETKENTLARDDAFIFKGNSDYKIVIPKNANGSDMSASSEINTFLSEATGVTLDVVTDDKVTYNSEAKYISLGNTTLLAEANIEKDDNLLGRSGFIIATKGKSYFLAGKAQAVTKGTLYAAYDFLKEMVGYEYYAPNCYSLDKTQNVPFKAINKVEVPDFAQRCIGYYSVLSNNDYKNRMRLESFSDAETWIVCGHTTNAICNAGEQKDAHPDWFDQSDFGSICYSNVELQEWFAEQAKTYILNNPYGEVFHLGQADSRPQLCTCPNCTKIKKETNSAGLVIQFINGVSKFLTPWLEKNCPDRNIKLAVFAYDSTEIPPANYNPNTKKWEPMNESVRPRDNVAIWWAPYYMDYSKPIGDESVSANKASGDALKAWHDLLGDGKIYSWCYCINFHHFDINFPNFGAIGDTYKFYKENGLYYLFEQGAVNSVTASFEELRIYLHSKLAWDTDADVNELVKNFITNYYGPGSIEMQKYYDRLNAFYRYYLDDEGDYKTFDGTIYAKIHNSEIWTINVLKSFGNLFENALKDVENSSCSAEMKKAYKDRINRLYLTIEWFYLDYPTFFTDEQLNEINDNIEYYQNMYDIHSRYE